MWTGDGLAERRATADRLLVSLADTPGVTGEASPALLSQDGDAPPSSWAYGVLLDTLVVRSLLVPALVRDIGERAWWPGRAGPGEAAQQADR